MKILLGSDDYRGKELLESPIEYFSVKLGKQNETKKNQHIRLYQDLASGTKRIRELSPRIFGLSSRQRILLWIASGIIHLSKHDMEWLSWKCRIWTCHNLS